MLGHGFLGTNASLMSDLSLLLGVLVALTLTVGVIMARRKKITAHRWIQSTAVTLNVLQVLVVMVGSFARSAAPGVPHRLGDGYYAIAMAHGLLGLVALVLGVFVAVRANELLPGFLHVLRFHNFKLYMRTAYGLYIVSTLLGVGVYFAWYGPSKPTETVEPVAAVDEIVVPMADFEFSPRELVVTVGTTIVWLNQDAAPHTATADDGRAFNTDILARGQGFRFTATQVGEFSYFCELHGSAGGVGMAGKVTVVGGDQPHVAAPAPPPPAAIVATPVPTPVPTAEPRIAEPHIASPRPRGQAIWRDDTLRSDAVFIYVDHLPTDQEYSAWLSGADGRLLLGRLDAGRDGAHTLTYTSEDQHNLLGGFDRVSVGRNLEEAVLSGTLPEKALVHLRHVLVGIPATPKGIGFGLGLRQETDELLRHAQFLAEAMDDGNLPLEKLHAEHMINLIEGAEGEHFGDLNGNGKIDNPGDGYGLLENGSQDGYVSGMREHARLAAEAADATAEIKLHAGHVQIAGENTQSRASELRDRALAILSKRSVADTRVEVQKVLSLAHQTIQGVDLNGDEQVAPTPGEGGASVAYQHAQLMAAIPLSGSTPTAVAVHQHAAPAPSPVRIAIGDNTYTPQTLSVPLGTLVTWSQDGQRPHTVTADDATFDSGLMRNGGTFERIFDAVGTFLYYCELHGGPGGAGMAAEITVEN
jgi:plastocyanin/uncharacterized membrane protein YozB (DUF420 family)